MGDDLVEILVGLGEGLALGRDVAVMKGPERRADLLEEFEAGLEADLGDRDGILAALPRADDGARAERIGTRAPKRVPVRDGEAQVLADGAAVDDLVGIVVAKREGVGGAGSFVSDGRNAGKVGGRFFGHKGGGIWDE